MLIAATAKDAVVLVAPAIEGTQSAVVQLTPHFAIGVSAPGLESAKVAAVLEFAKAFWEGHSFHTPELLHITSLGAKGLAYGLCRTEYLGDDLAGAEFTVLTADAEKDRIAIVRVKVGTPEATEVLLSLPTSRAELFAAGARTEHVALLQPLAAYTSTNDRYTISPEAAASNCRSVIWGTWQRMGVKAGPIDTVISRRKVPKPAGVAVLEAASEVRIIVGKTITVTPRMSQTLLGAPVTVAPAVSSPVNH